MKARLLLLLIIISCIHCAKLVPPGGGPIDQIAPQIVPSESTPNGLTNFKPDQTEFTFDEYIILKNPARNIIISPPLSPPPEFYLSGKTVVGDWSAVDSFRSNTTYTVNLGNAVEDINEGNPLTDFTFAFSTGPHLDSLQWQIDVLDTEGEPAEAVTVLLYKDLRDSIVSQDLPYYFAKTNAFGTAKFQYLKEGTYKVVALKDNNRTLTYDLTTEAIGFVENPVLIPADTGSVEAIRLFLPAEEPILTTAPFHTKNRIAFVLTAADTLIDIHPVNNNVIAARRWVEDSLFFWPEKNVNDTLKFEWKKEDTLLTYEVEPPDSFIQIEPRAMNPLVFKGKNAPLIWNQPVLPPGEKALFWTDSAGKAHYFSIISHHPLKSEIGIPEVEIPKKDTLMALPGMIETIYGIVNEDTLVIPYNYSPSSEFGSYVLNLNSNDSSSHYIGRLVKGSEVIARKYFQGDTTYIWELGKLRPGDYQLEVIADKNKNGKQDGGSYWEKRYPEIPEVISLPTLKANWTIEEEIELINEVKGK